MEPRGRVAWLASGSEPPLRRPRRSWGARLTLSSSQVEGPGPEDRLRIKRGATVAVLYADFECPRCGLAWMRLRDVDLTLGLRHFPIKSAHPRAEPAARAAEAAAMQGAFWKMVDSLFLDQGRLEEPHLWQRALDLGLDLDRFQADRQMPEVTSRIESDFRAAIRAGVATTPSVLVGGAIHQGVPDESQVARWAAR